MTIVLNAHYDDLDQLREAVQDWDLDFRLMEAGGFRGSVTQLVLPDVLIGRARFFSGLTQQGSTPSGFRTFGIPGPAVSGFWSRGRLFSREEVLRYPRSNEIASASGADFDIVAVSLSERLIESLCESFKVDWLDDHIEAVTPTAKAMSRLRGTAQAACSATTPTLRSLAAHALAEQLVTCFSGRTRLVRPRQTSRDLAIGRIIDFLNREKTGVPTSADLCREACVSERTLQYAFLHRYGITPGKFVRYWRLNDTRRALRTPSIYGGSVAKTAEHFGFHNPSTFAREFRLLFNELPSETVARKS